MSSTYVRGLLSSGSSLAWNRFNVSQIASHFSWTDRGSQAVLAWGDDPPAPPAALAWGDDLSTAVIMSSRLLSTGRTCACTVSGSKKPLGPRGAAAPTVQMVGA